jgi:glycosyltransferase involved in cell wall biosynthesis
MRIVIVQGPFLPVPPLLGGAVERVMASLGRLWAEAGCQVTHISRRFPGLPHEERAQGVHHIRVRSADAPRNALLFRLYELAYCQRALRVLPPADIVLVNSVVMPLVLRHKRAGKLVVRIGRPPKGQLRFYRHVDLVQTVSRDTQQRILAEAPWMEGRVSLVGSPLEGPLQPLGDGGLRFAREPLVTYVGRLHPEKGLELLLEAFLQAAAAPGWRLQLIGPSDVAAGGGGPAYADRLKAIAERAPDRILLRAPIFDPALLAAELRRSAIFAYPSLAERGEALPLAPLEAAGQGAVPLVSALACFDDYVTPGVSGAVFDHRTADPARALAGRLTELMADEALRDRLRRGALASAHRYIAPAIAERHLADFRRLCADGGTSRPMEARAAE